MHIVIVQIQVKEEKLDQFIPAMLKNLRHSLQEPGITQFDFFQDKEDHSRFILIEVYKEERDYAQHQQTAHYLEWKATAADMMQGPRTRGIYQEVPEGK